MVVEREMGRKERKAERRDERIEREENMKKGTSRRQERGYIFFSTL